LLVCANFQKSVIANEVKQSSMKWYKPQRKKEAEFPNSTSSTKI